MRGVKPKFVTKIKFYHVFRRKITEFPPVSFNFTTYYITSKAVPPFPYAPAPQDAEPAEPPAEIIPTTANATKARPAEAATPPATQAEQVFERKERITAPAAEH